jgi:cell wall-associated NlpC family hydrolase
MRAEFIAAARGFDGVTWRHIGRSRLGIDCVGLVLLAARQAGHIVEDVPSYRRGANGYDVVREIAARTVPANLTAPAEGDIILFRDGLYPCHCGVLAREHGAWSLIHAHAKRGRVLEEPFDPHWRALATHAFALPELI